MAKPCPTPRQPSSALQRKLKIKSQNPTNSQHTLESPPPPQKNYISLSQFFPTSLLSKGSQPPVLLPVNHLCESALLYDFVVLLGSQLPAYRPLRAITLTVGVPVFPHKALGTFNIVNLRAICRTITSLDSPELPGRIVGKGHDRAPQPGQGDEG